MTMFSSFWMANPGGGGYSVGNSILLDDGSSQYLTGPTLSGGSERIGTYSFWTKRANLGTQQEIYTQYRTSTNNFAFRIKFLSGDTLDITCENDSGIVLLRRTTTQVFRDPHAFLHVHVQINGNKTDDTCCTLTINGSAVSDFSTKTNLSSGTDLNLFTSSKSAFIGSTPAPAGYYDGYFSEFVAIDGGNAAATSFGEYDTNGVWRPIDVSGLTFGTNGFYLPFTDSTFLGVDGNGTETAVVSYQSSQWTGNTGSYSYSDGRIDATTADDAIKSVDTFTGDFELEFYITDKGNVVVGMYEISEDGTFNQNLSTGGLNSMTNSWWIKTSSVAANNDVMYGSTEVAGTVGWADGDTVKITRSSGTFTVYRNGSSLHEWSQTSSNEVRIAVAQGDVNVTLDQFCWVDAGTLGNNFFTSGSPTQSSDTPTNVYPVLSPINETWSQSATLAQGNLNATGSASYATVRASIPLTSGKWYWGTQLSTTTGNNLMSQIINELVAVGTNIPASTTANAWDCYWNSSTLTGRSNGTTIAGTLSAAVEADKDFAVWALDIDNSKIWLGVYDKSADSLQWMDSAGTIRTSDEPGAGTNATWSSIAGSTFWPAFIGTSGYNATFDFGAGTALGGASITDFTAPSGFSLINTTNLYTNAAPTIEDGTAYFQATTYTGTGSAREVNQSGNTTFQPDWVWVKERGGINEHRLIDAVRGATKTVYLGGALGSAAEATESTGVTSFDSDGFSVGTGGGYNNLNDTYVGWQWKGDGTSGASNTNGTITTTVNVDQTSGFSIVNWLGDNVDLQTIGHGLGATPSMMIYRKREGSQWFVQHAGLTGGIDNGTSTKQLILDGADPEGGPFSGGYIDTVGSSTVRLKKGSSSMNNCNASGDNYMAYMFAEISGYSAFGSYVGNGISDGSITLLSFRPAFILLKKSSGAANDWTIWDNQLNPSNLGSSGGLLRPNLTNAEQSTSGQEIDVLSNGFKIRNGNNQMNTSGNTYIYAAFSENPFAGSSPATAR